MKILWMIAISTVVLSGITQASFVTIGDAGNTVDPSTGYGAVTYEYKISDHEVTIAEFQISGAGNGYENYWNDGTRTVGDDAPATFVSLYEAMRYCNWLTSGNVDYGAYIFGGGSYQATDRDAAVAAYGIIYALPTEDEWYKAAYYTGDSEDLWSLYANGTDTAPTTAEARYNTTAVWPVGSGITEQNGTFDMMGNVWEWVEDDNGVYRGGSCFFPASYLDDRISYNPPHSAIDDLGFRVVMIPEPSTVLLFGIGGVGAYLFRRSQKAKDVE